MINRLKDYMEEPDERRPEDAYFVVNCLSEYHYVSRETAAALMRRLASVWKPTWLAFTDLSGSSVRVRARLIESIYESTTAQRQAKRDFYRAREREDKADRRLWDNDD